MTVDGNVFVQDGHYRRELAIAVSLPAVAF